MLNLNLSIINPWQKDKFKNIFNWSALPFETKGVEFEIYYTDTTVLELGIDWTHRCDHAGLELRIGLFGYTASFNIYDTRHWDHKKRQWQVYNTD